MHCTPSLGTDAPGMDPFQLRLECLALVRRLTASQQSIAKVVDFAAKQATSAADDIWDCILGECQKVRQGSNAMGGWAGTARAGFCPVKRIWHSKSPA